MKNGINGLKLSSKVSDINYPVNTLKENSQYRITNQF